MTRSRGRLVVAGNCGQSIPMRAAATSPQRWTLARRSGGAWLEAYHQLIGDGAFGGDRAKTRIAVTDGAGCVVRGISATPLRRGESVTAVRISAHGGGMALYLPGALVPHEGADHTSLLTIATGQNGCVLAASLLTPGRSGSGERLEFERLRFRTRVVIDGRERFAEAAETGNVGGLDGPGGFAGAGVFVNILAAGPWDVTTTDWWNALPLPQSMAGGPSELSPGVLGFRALCGTLGDATAFVNAVAERVVADFFPS